MRKQFICELPEALRKRIGLRVRYHLTLIDGLEGEQRDYAYHLIMRDCKVEDLDGKITPIFVKFNGEEVQMEVSQVLGTMGDNEKTLKTFLSITPYKALTLNAYDKLFK